MADTEAQKPKLESPPPPVVDAVEDVPPAHGPEVDSDGESVLSDIDDDVFKSFDDSVIGGNVIAIDEETMHAIGKHKIKRTPNEVAASGPRKKKEKRRRDFKRRREDDHHDSPARRELPEVELTPAESKSCCLLLLERRDGGG